MNAQPVFAAKIGAKVYQIESVVQLRRLVQHGKLKAEDLIYIHYEQRWVRAGSYSRLHDLFNRDGAYQPHVYSPGNGYARSPFAPLEDVADDAAEAPAMRTAELLATDVETDLDLDDFKGELSPAARSRELNAQRVDSSRELTPTQRVRRHSRLVKEFYNLADDEDDRSETLHDLYQEAVAEVNGRDAAGRRSKTPVPAAAPPDLRAITEISPSLAAKESRSLRAATYATVAATILLLAGFIGYWLGSEPPAVVNVPAVTWSMDRD